MSEQIRLLERSLSTALFRRVGRGVVPTEARSVLRRHQNTLTTPLFCASLEPRLYDHFAIVHRPNTILSRPIQAVIEMATARMREICG